jgi:2-hydroxy-3-keto-5-methylthiopentenyl-1-phosphate phosphatase
LDFVIKYFLELNRCLELVEINAPTTQWIANTIKLTFPRLLDKTSINLKDDLVRYYKSQGRRTIYIGDGTADFPAIRIADFPFVIETSALAKLCKKMDVSHREITDFQEVISEIRNDYVEERG